MHPDRLYYPELPDDRPSGLDWSNKGKAAIIPLAGGGQRVAPALTGINNAGVLTSGVLHKKPRTYLRYISPQMMAGLTKYYLPVGKRVVVIGGRIHGCEIAEFLVKRGRQVSIVDEIPEDKLGEGMTGDDKYSLFPWFDKKGVERYLRD